MFEEYDSGVYAVNVTAGQTDGVNVGIESPERNVEPRLVDPDDATDAVDDPAPASTLSLSPELERHRVLTASDRRGSVTLIDGDTDTDEFSDKRERELGVILRGRLNLRRTEPTAVGVSR